MNESRAALQAASGEVPAEQLHDPGAEAQRGVGVGVGGQIAMLFDALPSAAAEVTLPVLVVRGAESDVVGEADGRELAAMFPDARFVQIEGAGHTVQGDTPRDLAAARCDFLSQ